MSDQTNSSRTLALAAREAARLTVERHPGLDLAALVEAALGEHPELRTKDIKAAIIALLNRGILVQNLADGRINLG